MGGCVFKVSSNQLDRQKTKMLAFYAYQCLIVLIHVNALEQKSKSRNVQTLQDFWYLRFKNSAIG